MHWALGFCSQRLKYMVHGVLINHSKVGSSASQSFIKVKEDQTVKV